MLTPASDRLASGSATVTLEPQPLPDPVAFDPPGVLPDAEVGAFYQYNFLPFASGGNPPYHFQLDTFGGFPPIGLILSPDGILSGTPSIARTTTFRVCAVDLSGNNECPQVTITVEPEDTAPPPPPPPAGSTSGTWKGIWTRRVSGLCDYETSEMTWTLAQSGTSVSGSLSRRITAVDPEGFCPNNVGAVLTDTLVGGSLNGSSLSIFTSGGTSFTGTISGSTITGTGGTGSFSNGAFTLNKL